MLPNLEPPINDLRLLNYLLKVKLDSSQDKDIIQTLLFQKSINNGYIDKFKNKWVKGPSRTAGQEFEWDVQLSELGSKQLGWASRDGKHINASLDGKITHK